jgi:hypothetical protein
MLSDKSRGEYIVQNDESPDLYYSSSKIVNGVNFRSMKLSEKLQRVMQCRKRVHSRGNWKKVFTWKTNAKMGA